MKKLFTLLLAISWIFSANANEYLGFNLCGKMTDKQVTEVVRKANAKLKKSKEDEFPNTYYFEIKNYPVANQVLDIRVSSFNDEIYEIVVDTAKQIQMPFIHQLLTEKYGEGDEQRITRPFGIEATAWKFNTEKLDPNLALQYFKTDESVIAGVIFPSRQQVEYICKPVLEKYKSKRIENHQKKIKEINQKSKL